MAGVKEIIPNLAKETVTISTAGEGVKIIVIENGRAGEMNLPKYGEVVLKIHDGKITDKYITERTKGLFS
ncbi:hypothetical protein ACKE5C_19260 (plasmid) [Aneurinibacillus thermoaerophilus]|uniref:Uncharacterized protein n=1 Tax=Aneurinibacillus thermoaerophilus TaxID=143495 RepID=A0ABX8YHB0_ANETH|nr:hypothetical protein [Aneurinibacillus thermoaerophilus]QYY44755.1 hypothetical protein K3F53_19115 [Aneurinibacillus thermoaerophilus]